MFTGTSGKIKSLCCVASAALSVLALSAGTPAFADDNAQGSDPQTEVIYNVGSEYVINIPPTVQIGSNKMGELAISASSANVESGKAVNVRVKDDGTCTQPTWDSFLKRYWMTLTNAQGKQVMTSMWLLQAGEDSWAGGYVNYDDINTVIFQLKGQSTTTANGNVGIEFVGADGQYTDNDPIAAGTYVDTLTFTIAVEDE